MFGRISEFFSRTKSSHFVVDMTPEQQKALDKETRGLQNDVDTGYPGGTRPNIDPTLTSTPAPPSKKTSSTQGESGSSNSSAPTSPAIEESGRAFSEPSAKYFKQTAQQHYETLKQAYRASSSALEEYETKHPILSKFSSEHTKLSKEATSNRELLRSAQNSRSIKDKTEKNNNIEAILKNSVEKSCSLLEIATLEAEENIPVILNALDKLKMNPDHLDEFNRLLNQKKTITKEQVSKLIETAKIDKKPVPLDTLENIQSELEQNKLRTEDELFELGDKIRSLKPSWFSWKKSSLYKELIQEINGKKLWNDLGTITTKPAYRELAVHLYELAQAHPELRSDIVKYSEDFIDCIKTPSKLLNKISHKNIELILNPIELQLLLFNSARARNATYDMKSLELNLQNSKSLKPLWPWGKKADSHKELTEAINKQIALQEPIEETMQQLCKVFQKTEAQLPADIKNALRNYSRIPEIRDLIDRYLQGESIDRGLLLNACANNGISSDETKLVSAMADDILELKGNLVNIQFHTDSIMGLIDNPEKASEETKLARSYRNEQDTLKNSALSTQIKNAQQKVPKDFGENTRWNIGARTPGVGILTHAGWKDSNFPKNDTKQPFKGTRTFGLSQGGHTVHGTVPLDLGNMTATQARNALEYIQDYCDQSSVDKVLPSRDKLTGFSEKQLQIIRTRVPRFAIAAKNKLNALHEELKRKISGSKTLTNSDSNEALVDSSMQKFCTALGKLEHQLSANVQQAFLLAFEIPELRTAIDEFLTELQKPAVTRDSLEAQILNFQTSSANTNLNVKNSSIVKGCLYALLGLKTEQVNIQFHLDTILGLIDPSKRIRGEIQSGPEITRAQQLAETALGKDTVWSHSPNTYGLGILTHAGWKTENPKEPFTGKATRTLGLSYGEQIVTDQVELNLGEVTEIQAKNALEYIKIYCEKFNKNLEPPSTNMLKNFKLAERDIIQTEAARFAKAAQDKIDELHEQLKKKISGQTS